MKKVDSKTLKYWLLQTILDCVNSGDANITSNKVDELIKHLNERGVVDISEWNHV